MLLFYKLPELERIYRYTCENAQIPYLPCFFIALLRQNFGSSIPHCTSWVLSISAMRGTIFSLDFYSPDHSSHSGSLLKYQYRPGPFCYSNPYNTIKILLLDGDSHVTFKCVHNVNNVNFTWMHIRQIIKNTFSTKTTAPSSSCRMRRWCWSQKLLFLSTQHPPS